MKHDQNELLRAIQERPGLSLTGLAKHLEWFATNGAPYKSKVQRAMDALVKEGLIKKITPEPILHRGLRRQHTSLTRLARCLGFVDIDGTPDIGRVKRVMRNLAKQRQRGRYVLTPKGKEGTNVVRQNDTKSIVPGGQM
jgi:hypothetical protein